MSGLEARVNVGNGIQTIQRLARLGQAEPGWKTRAGIQVLQPPSHVRPPRHQSGSCRSTHRKVHVTWRHGGRQGRRRLLVEGHQLCHAGLDRRHDLCHRKHVRLCVQRALRVADVGSTARDGDKSRLWCPHSDANNSRTVLCTSVSNSVCAILRHLVVLHPQQVHHGR